MPDPIRVLVTGSAGRIGRAAVSALQDRGHQVRGFDRVTNPALRDCAVGELGDRAALERAMEGIACVVHLAATPDDDDVLERLVPNNVVGLFHLMEAARGAGVKRIILASSTQVNWWQRVHGEVPIHPSDPPSPRSWYAATKMFMESIGRSFAETHGISVIVARLGWCPRTPAQVAEIAAEEWAQDLYLSPGDAGRFIACAVEAPPTLRHAVVNATSRPLHRILFDLSDAATLLGYEPKESWPQGIEVVSCESTAPSRNSPA